MLALLLASLIAVPALEHRAQEPAEESAKVANSAPTPELPEDLRRSLDEIRLREARGELDEARRK